MRDNKDFDGWTLEDWSLRHGLLELRFHYWPTLSSCADSDDPKLHSGSYRGKELFIHPTRIAFVDVTTGPNITKKAVVEKTTMSTSDEKIICRFSLTHGASVEIEAESFLSARW